MQSCKTFTIEKDFNKKLDLLLKSAGKTHNCKILVAFSGGCDSLALLLLLSKTFSKENVVALYVNHRLRSDSELEKELCFNTQNCRRIGIKLVVEDLGEDAVRKLAKQRKKGIEEAARVLRYNALKRNAVIYGCSIIATAHHKDDQIETLLMRLERKSPLTSLLGIRDIIVSDKQIIIRPLLDFTKNQLQTYLENYGFCWSFDSTNEDISILRNYLRTEKIPLYRDSDSKWEEKLLRTRETVLKQCENFVFDNTDSVSIDYYRSLNEVQRLIVVFAMWKKVMTDMLPQNLILRLDKAVENYNGKCIQVGSNSAIFSLCNRQIFLTSDKDEKKYKDYCREIDVFSDSLIQIPGFLFKIGVKEDEKTLFFLPEDFKGKVYLRFPKEGEKMTLSGGTKRLSRILQDMKIPPSLRKRTPVLADSLGICAVFGRVYGAKDRLSQRFRHFSDNSETLNCEKKYFTCMKS